VLLAIDTSTSVASVAFHDGRVIFETTWLAGHDHTRQLLPRINEGLAAIGRSVAQIEAIGVAIGPGSFNGLRVGLATAKAICLANGLPIIGVDTMLLTAYQYRLTGRPTRPLYAAGKDEVATGLYQAEGETFRTLEAPRLSKIDDVVGDSPADTLFCGEIRPAWRERILSDPRFGYPDTVFPRSAEETRRAGYLAELARNLWQAGAVDDLATLEPLYLRRPAITPRAGALGGVAT